MLKIHIQMLSFFIYKCMRNSKYSITKINTHLESDSKPFVFCFFFFFEMI